jgi:hypothetical protein
MQSVRLLYWADVYLLSSFDIIQHPIRHHRTQLNQLLNPQRGMTSRAIQVKRQIGNHRLGRSQGFTEVGEQAFVVDVFGDDEYLAGFGYIFGLCRFWRQVVIQDALGGFVEFPGIGFGLRGGLVRLGRIGRWFEYKLKSFS